MIQQIMKSLSLILPWTNSSGSTLLIYLYLSELYSTLLVYLLGIGQVPLLLLNLAMVIVLLHMLIQILQFLFVEELFHFILLDLGVFTFFIG